MEQAIYRLGRIGKDSMHARRRVVQFAWLSRVQQRRRKMQVGSVADGRLRLVRYKLGAKQSGRAHV